MHYKGTKQDPDIKMKTFISKKKVGVFNFELFYCLTWRNLNYKELT